MKTRSFYRELWSGAPVDPANIRSLDDLRRLPILTKDHLRREQEAHPPFGRYLCIPGRPHHPHPGDLRHHGEPHHLRNRPRRLGPNCRGPCPHPVGRGAPA